jgi:hypothetical protein
MRRPPPWVFALLGYAALAALVLGPSLLAPMSEAIGHPQADTWNHVWGYHQVRSALLSGESPLFTTLIGWPSGGALWFIDLFGALWTLPVQLLGGPVLAYNLGLFGNLVLAGFGAWALARHVTKSEAGAALAGLGYAAMPQLLGQLHNGISETLAVGWLPLAVLAMLRFREHPDRRRGLVAGGALAVCLIANGYYGLFAGLVAVGLAVAALLPGHRNKQVRRSLPWAALGVLPALPPLWLFRSTLSSSQALVERDPDFVYRSLVGHNMVDLLAFFHPGDFHSPDLLGLFDEHLQVVVYIGWLLLIPAGWALVRIRASRPWGAAALVCFVFALGPFLYLDGNYAQLPGGGWIPLPFLAFFELLPIFSPISHAYRFAIPLQLAVCVLAAFAVGPRWRLGVGLMPLLLAELLLASPGTWPVETSPVSIPAAYASIATPGAVLDLPVSLQVLDRSRYNLYQVQHGRPIPYGLNDPTPALLDDNRLLRMLVDLERSSIDSAPPTLPALDLVLARRQLVAQGLAAIVVHGEAYAPTTRDKVLEVLTLVCGEPRQVGSAWVFELG